MVRSDNQIKTVNEVVTTWEIHPISNATEILEAMLAGEPPPPPVYVYDTPPPTLEDAFAVTGETRNENPPESETGGNAPAEAPDGECPPADTEAEEKERETVKNAGLKELFQKRKRLGSFADPQSDEGNPNAIFRDKYLRRGGMLLFVSPSGTGKSTFVSQASECWAMGWPFMGITPARPLSIGVFETEDDADEIADFRNNFRRGFKAQGWTDEQIDEAENGVNAPVYYETGHKSGDEFIRYLSYCQSEAHHDLVIINPAYDFIGGDLSKQEVVSSWKEQLFKAMEDGGFAVLLVHHTNKVPSSPNERRDWCAGAAATYAGSGSMVLPSSARAVIFMGEVSDGVFQLTAAKRGKRLGWTDAEGRPTIVKNIAHSEGMIFWREATPEEAETANKAQGVRRGKTLAEKDAEREANQSAKQKKLEDALSGILGRHNGKIGRTALRDELSMDTKICPRSCSDFISAKVSKGELSEQPELMRDEKGGVREKPARSGGVKFVGTKDAIGKYRDEFNMLGV